jgi:ring-1,2-phenylacetyl-CoA epoxidase subunit PaaD
MVITKDKIYDLLQNVKDPEIPHISIIELGMINDVNISDNRINIDLTPTFIACPAINHIKEEVVSYINNKTGLKTNVNVSIEPPWTSNRITEKGKQILKDFGLAPPKKHDGNICFKLLQNVSCPYCNSNDTLIRSNFGSTLCRSMHYCKKCKQGFEHFKPI